MSEMEVTEGQLLSRDFGVGSPPAVVEIPPPSRTVETVTLEIRTLQHQAQGIILSYAIEIGRRLEEAKAMLSRVVQLDSTILVKASHDIGFAKALDFLRKVSEDGQS